MRSQRNIDTKSHRRRRLLFQYCQCYDSKHLCCRQIYINNEPHPTLLPQSTALFTSNHFLRRFRSIVIIFSIVKYSMKNMSQTNQYGTVIQSPKVLLTFSISCEKFVQSTFIYVLYKKVLFIWDKTHAITKAFVLKTQI